MKYYPQELLSARPIFNSVLERIKMVWQNPDETILNYYDTTIKAGDFFARVDQVAKSLVSMGVKKGDAMQYIQGIWAISPRMVFCLLQAALSESL